MDADLKDFFGSVEHEKLLTLVAQRVADGRVLRLIEAMLKAGSYGKGRLFPTERGTPQGGVIAPRTQKVTLTAWRAFGSARSGRAATGRGRRGNRNAMPNHDSVVADENVLDDQAHDALALDDVKRVGGAAQSGEERRESLGQAQERSAIGSLVGDRLQLGAQRLFALPQRGHALAQLLERQELLLIGVEKSFDASCPRG